MIDHRAPGREHPRWFGWLSLFTSFGTLICCALPSLLVLAGLGATVASLLSAAPWLVALSRHKTAVFATSGLTTAAGFLYVYRIAPRLRARQLTCPPDDDSCAAADRVSRVLLWISAMAYTVGLTAAYLIPALLARLDQRG